MNNDHSTAVDPNNCNHCFCKVNTGGHYYCCRCGSFLQQVNPNVSETFYNRRESLKYGILGILKMYGEFPNEYLADLILGEMDKRLIRID